MCSSGNESHACIEWKQNMSKSVDMSESDRNEQNSKTINIVTQPPINPSYFTCKEKGNLRLMLALTNHGSGARCDSVSDYTPLLGPITENQIRKNVHKSLFNHLKSGFIDEKWDLASG